MNGRLGSGGGRFYNGPHVLADPKLRTNWRTMVDQQGKVREVAWNELFPWLILLRTIRIGLFVRILILGAIGLVATTAGWKAITWAFAGAEDPLIQKWEVQGG